jgi:hypothetical protein
MSKLFLQLHKFKKLHSDDKTTTFEHDDGHTITVAHAKLSPKMRAEMESLPIAKGGGSTRGKKEAPKGGKSDATPVKMAEGGEVPASRTDSTPTDPTLDIQQSSPVSEVDSHQVELDKYRAMMASKPEDSAGAGLIDKLGSAAKFMVTGPDNPFAPPAAAPAAKAAQTVAGGAEAPQGLGASQSGGASTSGLGMGGGDPFGTQAYENAYMGGLGEQKAGIQGEAKALGQEGKAEAQVLQQAQVQQQKQAADYQTHFSQLDAERQAFMHDIQNSHIDPNHYLNNMSTGSKVSTGIGMLLGGLGSGLTGGENPVMKFLNDQINRDVDAQKAELGKKENLLSANMKQFGNLKDATEMTRVMQLDMLKNQLQQASANAKDPLAKARAQQAIGQLDTQSAGIVSQMAMRKTLLSGMNSGRLPPERVVEMMVPEKDRPEARKQLKEAQDTIAFRDNLLSAFDKISQLNTPGGRIGSPIQSKAQIEALKQPLVAALSKNTAGRFTEQDAGMLEPLFKNITDDPTTVALKRQQVLKMAEEKMHFPVLDFYGIGAGGMGRYKPTGESRIQMAPPVPTKR